MIEEHATPTVTLEDLSFGEAVTTSGQSRMQYDEVQSNAIRLAVEERKSLLIAGKPGTGKTHVTREIVRQLRSREVGVEYVSYMWQTAANAGEGCISAHSLVSQGLLDRPLRAYVEKKTKRFRDICSKLKHIETLDWEELQTGDLPFYDKLESIFREVMGAERNPAAAYEPWGGVQLIANGDIMQAMKRYGKDSHAGYESVDYTFDLPGYEEWFNNAVILSTVYRTNDKGYISFVQRVGENCITEQDAVDLRSRVGKEPPPGVKVYAWSNREVHAINAKYVADHPGDTVAFTATAQHDTGAESKCGEDHIQAAYAILRDRLHSRSSVPTFEAKAGCEVVLEANVDPANGLHKGRRGVIQKFVQERCELPPNTMVYCDGDLPSNTPLVAWDNGSLHAVTSYAFSQPIRDLHGNFPLKPLY